MQKSLISIAISSAVVVMAVILLAPASTHAQVYGYGNYYGGGHNGGGQNYGGGNQGGYGYNGGGYNNYGGGYNGGGYGYGYQAPRYGYQPVVSPRYFRYTNGYYRGY